MPLKPTPSFEKWFGASKVVDSEGQPKVVYHSTYSSFDEFSKTRDLGFHFGSAFAANKRIDGATTGRGRGVEKFDSVNVIPAYLAIKNPFHLARDPITWQPQYLIKLAGEALPEAEKVRLLSLDDTAVEVARAESARMIESGKGVIRRIQSWQGGKTFTELSTKNWSRLLSESRVGVYHEIKMALKSAGFDGITYVNEVEGVGRGATGRIKNPAENMTWVAFDSSQVKSALGNNGCFDAENTDIRFSLVDLDEEISAEAPCP